MVQVYLVVTWFGQAGSYSVDIPGATLFTMRWRSSSKLRNAAANSIGNDASKIV